MEKIFAPPAVLPLPFEVLPYQALEELEIPMVQCYVAAGFPSPADDYLEDQINLRQVLIQNPTATYLVRVRGESMRDARLHDGDILVVDRSLKPAEGHIIIGVVDGEFTVKQLVRLKGKLYLMPANEQYAPLELTEEMEFKPWGVVVWSLHKINGQP